MTVYLVGAGPGDPGLLTLRGAALLGRADAVVHDRLVDARVLSLSRPEAELIDVGKRPGGGEMAQAQINALLIERGRHQAVVVRLKGGDPYILGRGGEEALALAAAEVAYEVVPGVSSVAAVPAYAGVPLTMRGLSSSIVVVTGHDAGDPDASVDWDHVARSSATVVVLMGGARRADVARRLIEGGRSPATPVLVVESGTTPSQRSARTSLDALGDLEVANPATLVIGEVAAMTLASYEQRPLFAWRVVVTRAEEQADDLVAGLVDAAAVVVEFPTIAVTGPLDGGEALAGALSRVGEFDWIVLASANAVERVFAHLRDARQLAGTKVAAVGAATAQRLATHGIVADLVPERFDAESLVAAFQPAEPGGSIMLARSASGREVLVDGLRAKGWRVEAVEAYRVVRPEAHPDALAEVAAADAVLFASPSALAGFLEVAGADRLPPVVVTIGPVTSSAARAAGVAVTVEADPHTAGGMLEALLAYARGRTPPGAARRTEAAPVP